jgi:hypothetical protein
MNARLLKDDERNVNEAWGKSAGRRSFPSVYFKNGEYAST